MSCAFLEFCYSCDLIAFGCQVDFGFLIHLSRVPKLTALVLPMQMIFEEEAHQALAARRQNLMTLLR